MKIQILKPIKIAGHPCNLDDLVDINKSAAEIYIRKGFAKEAKGEPNANEVAAIISRILNKEDLEMYKEDTRQVVRAAYKKKENELNT